MPNSIKKDKLNNPLVSKPLVLVVDDNPNNIQAVGANLINHNISISMADSGKKALKSISIKKPDLILLDIMMPELDGFEVARLIKENPDTKDIPIIFITAKASAEDIVEGFEKGAVDYITKPFNPSELISRVNTHLKLKKFQDVINLRNKELENLNIELNELIGITAHDLKNPIYNIRLLAKTLQENDISKEDTDEFINDIVITSDKMLELIKNILEVNSAEQGKIKVNLTDTDIKVITEHIIKNYFDRASAKNINIHFDANNFNTTVWTDEKYFTQIIDNLLSNAVKYSEYGKNVWVTITNDEKNAFISIKDEGPGLSEEDQSKMYLKFTRLTPKPIGDESSTGLGLSIVKKYVELIDADIILHSELGKGCDFILEVPLKGNAEEEL